ncbi:MAG: hypothetical protein J6Q94_06375 [Clostridia bacterium]|nr:hypothetical protein [Clostridia bacterium]
MKKHYKTDYFEKLCNISKICNENFSYVYKILASQEIPPEKIFLKSKDIVIEINECLEKDYFTPFEREDIFIISKKLDILNDYLYLLFIFLSENNFFSFTKNTINQIEHLSDLSTIIHEIFISLSVSQKNNLSKHIADAEIIHQNLIRQIYSENSKNAPVYHYIEKCTDTSNEIIQLIQYTLLKNS